MKISSIQRDIKSEDCNYSVSRIQGHCCAVILSFLIISLFPGTAPAQNNNEWPIFHGSFRDNKSAEMGLLKSWPKKGPKLLWAVSGLGEGYSSVSIADGRIFTAGKKNDRSFVFAYDLNGKLLWEMPNGQTWSTTLSWAKTYTGSRGTPTYDNGVVYQLGETGRLTAFDHKTGQEIWAMNLCEKFDAEIPMYGYSESVLIDGDRLYCNPAGKKAFMVCLDKSDGSIIWSNKEIPGVAGYSTGIIADFGGYRQIINFSSNNVYGIDSKTGKLLWNHHIECKHSLNCTDAIFHEGYVFITTGYGVGSMLLKLGTLDGKITAELVWKTELMDNHHGGVILHEGYLYGAGHEARGWFCLEFMTGKEVWKSRGKGSLVYADGMFYLLEEKGGVKLIKATHEAYDEVGSFETPEGGKGMYWAHPVVCGGRLYIRHADILFAYDVSGN